MKNYDVAKEIAFNARNVILWQYDNAPNFNALIAMKQNFYDYAVSDFWERWIVDVLNIQTANFLTASTMVRRSQWLMSICLPW